MQCIKCRRPYPEVNNPYRCSVCGGLYDFKNIPPFNIKLVDNSLKSIWRYRHTFGLLFNTEEITLGEGDTPLVWSNVFGKKVGFKVEYQNPTGSFKDRSTSILVSFLKSRGVKQVVEDSSGNAGASLAAYVACAGTKATIYVPAYASGPKRAQIAAYGAEIINVPGPRSEAAKAVRKAAERGKTYASHSYLPHGLPGYATIAYELLEQIGMTPGTVISPVGQGSLLLGIGRGFAALKAAKQISKAPVLIGVQAKACAPLWVKFKQGWKDDTLIDEGATIAEGVRIRYPHKGKTLIELITETRGSIVAVDEVDILSGREHLAKRGMYVEPTSAIVWNALEQVIKDVPEPIAVILTGSGFKSHM